MKVQVRFYSYFKDLAGIEAIDETLPEGATIADLTTRLHTRFPKLAGTARSTLVAIGVDYARPEDPLHEGAQVSFFPPVQGG